MTYPDPAVAEYIAERFIPLKLSLNSREHWPYFRARNIIWTPTVGFLDRNGGMHYHSVGYLPPSEFMSALRIGRARCLMAWMRSAEAVDELEAAAAADNSFSPEALYWLGIANYLCRRETPKMWEAWDRLVELYPHSPWARRVYPRPSPDTSFQP